MPVVVIVVLAATALVLAAIVAGPSRRIRQEARLPRDDYYAVMTGEAPTDDQADDEAEGEAEADEPGP